MSAMRRMLTLIVCVLGTVFGTAAACAAEEAEPRVTGCVPPNAEQREWERKHMVITKHVRPNALGLERLNAERRAKGHRALGKHEVDLADDGSEVEGQTAAAAAAAPAATGTGTGTGTASATALPTYVDNSTLKYFPPVRSQGSIGSCAQWSGMYYVFTYMNAMARDLDVKNGGAGNNNYIFSPKFTYNMVNGGSDSGSWYTSGWAIAQKHGCATWQDWPYDSDYRGWPLTYTVWRNAMNYRADTYGFVSGVNTQTGLDQLKQMLANGYIVSYATDIYGWKFKAVGNDPSTTADDAFAGKQACYYCVTSSSGHAMTIVGYNDDIWIDINSNGVVDAGEKGALRIVNSWGTGWYEGGFTWLAYDALKATSAVTGAPSASRVAAFWSNQVAWVTAKPTYTPKLVGRFTLNHLKRNQLRMTLGVSDTAATAPTTIWYPNSVLYYAGGAYAFNGSATAAVDGTFAFDFTDLVPATPANKRYYLGMYDTTTGDIATMKDFRLINVAGGNAETVCTMTPLVADLQQVYAYTNFDNSNTSPVISSFSPAATVTVAAGATQPFTVDCWDLDGDVLAYTWKLDGAVVPVTTATMNYTPAAVDAGNHSISVTVSDGRGGGATQAWTVTVSAPTVTMSVADNLASEPGTDTGRYTISRSGGITTLPLTVYYAMSGTAANGTDYVTLPGSVVIPAGTTSVTVTVTPLNDALVEGSETVVMTLSANSAYKLGTATTGTINLLDDELPVLSVSIADSLASEPGTDTAAIRITRTGATTAALTVNYMLGGTATNGVDYAALSGSAVIAVGKTYVDVVVTPLDDAVLENKETVVLSLTASPTYQVHPTYPSGTVSILDDEMPIVNVAATDASAAEPAKNGVYTITRTGKLDVDVTVYYTMSGTAIKGTDYVAPTGSVVIPAGQSTATVTLTPIDDLLAEGKEYAQLNLTANAAYQVGAASYATVYIYDDEKPEVKFVATDASASETAPNPGVFTISCTPAAKADLVVKYTVGGTATNGVDYATLGTSAIIPAGQSSVAVTVNPIDDSVVESSETLTLTPVADAAYTLYSSYGVTVTLADNEPTVSVSATDSSAAETASGAAANTGTFTITRAYGVNTAPLVVTYTVSGTATAGTDYAALSGTVTIPAGAASATVTVTPIDDDLAESNETVVITLGASTTYRLGTASATVTIADNESTVSVSAYDAAAAETNVGVTANPGTFRISRTGGVNTNALTVPYTVGGTATNGTDYAQLTGTATIPAGASYVDVPVTPVNDAAVEGAETVVLTLQGASNYKLGTASATVTISDND